MTKAELKQEADMTEFSTLRFANRARQGEWDAGNQITLAYRANELAGEAGEACNVLKKLERERLGIRGSRATVEQLAEELADVVICTDLLAMSADAELQIGTGYPVGMHDAAMWGTLLASCVGGICHAIISERGIEIASRCLQIERAARGAAAAFDIDLDKAIAAKFNATSEKVGLQTRLAA